MTVENIDEVEEALTLEEGVDSSEVTKSLDVVKRDGDRAGHGHAAPVVEVGERLPNPEKVSMEDGFVLQRLYRLAGFFRDLFEPVLTLGLWALRPVEEA